MENKKETYDYQFSDVLSVYHRKQKALRGIMDAQQIFEEEQRKQVDKIEHLVTVLIQNETSREFQNMLDAEVKDPDVLSLIGPYNTFFHVLKVVIMGCLMKEDSFSKDSHFIFPGFIKEGEVLYTQFKDDIQKIEEHLGKVFIQVPSVSTGYAITLLN